MGGLFQLFGGKGRNIQELQYCLFFGLLRSLSELSWHLWVYYNSMLTYHNEHVMRLKVYSKGIWIFCQLESNWFYVTRFLCIQFFSQSMHHSWKIAHHPLPSCLSSATDTLLQGVLVLSHFSHVQLFANLWTIAHKVPLSMGFSRQQYWSG